MLVLLFASAAPFAPSAVAADPRPLIRTIDEFYAVPTTETTTARAFAWDLDVLYSDPDWNLLWVESDGLATFIPTAKDFPQFRCGQRVRAEGEIVPVHGVSLATARLTLLPEPSAITPLDATGRLADFEKYNNRLVTLEAVIDRQSDPDPAHLLLEASAEGFHIAIRVRIDPQAERPRLAGTIIRATGVYVGHRDFAGKLSSIALWVGSLAAVEVRSTLGEDAAFQEPLIRIEETTPRSSGRAVHLIGTVHALDNTAATITLRDATGQIEVLTAQNHNIRVGTTLEAVGVPETAGIHRRLRNARVRPLADRPGAAGPSGSAEEPLRLADQVLALEPEAADRGYSVQLFGIATWMAPDRRTIFLQDVSGGIEVSLPPSAQLPPVLPCTVRVAGRTARGAFAPLLAASQLVWSNPLGSPDPRPATLADLLGGNLHGNWVLAHAYLRAVRQTPQEVLLDLTTASGEFTAVLPPAARLAATPGSILSLRGVCAVSANARRQLVGVRLLVPDPACIEIEQGAPADPFALPVRSLAGLREFGPTDPTLRRICTLGTVLHHEPGRYLCLQDGTDTLLVLSRDTAPLQPGDRVEVVGLPGTEGSRMVLREAAYRRTGTGTGSPPAVVEIQQADPVDAALDGRLVELRGSVVATLHQPSGSVVTLQSGKRRFDALIAAQLDPAHCPDRAVVALRGVYRVIYDEYRQPIDFTLRLRTAADITLLEPPSVLTLERTLWAGGGLLLLTGAIVGWLAVLRARVARQTAQIRAQVEHQAKLEADLQKAHRIESLGLLAGGIAHDFNNLLTGILGNLSFARLEAHDGDPLAASLADAELAALRARDLTQRLLIFTKGGTPARAAVSLPELVRESVSLALHDPAVRPEFEFPPALWLADIDRVQIGQVVQNLAINAAQAMPAGGVLRIALANACLAAGFRADLAPGRYLRITVSDTGTGIPPDSLPKIFDPYFSTKKTGNGLGLATVFSIIRRHGGRIEVESSLGHGTTFRLWLPAAASDRPADESGGSPAPVAAPSPEALRVLVLDDDVAIRRMAATTLLHAGYEVATAANGREALALARAAQDTGHPFRLALLDLTVPGELGAKEILAGFRALDPQLRLVLTTGRTDDPTFLAAAEHGFDAALAKPYEARELLGRVAATLAPFPAS